MEILYSINILLVYFFTVSYFLHVIYLLLEARVVHIINIKVTIESIFIDFIQMFISLMLANLTNIFICRCLYLSKWTKAFEIITEFGPKCYNLKVVLFFCSGHIWSCENGEWLCVFWTLIKFEWFLFVSDLWIVDSSNQAFVRQFVGKQLQDSSDKKNTNLKTKLTVFVMCPNHLLNKKSVKRTLLPPVNLLHSKRKGIFIHPTAMFKNLPVRCVWCNCSI